MSRAEFSTTNATTESNESTQRSRSRAATRLLASVGVLAVSCLSVRRHIVAVVAATGLAFGGSALVAVPAAQADEPVGGITLDMSECGTMYLGTEGTCIVSLQHWMRMVTGNDLRITGVYDAPTLYAVYDFQSARRIPADGRFGHEERAALRKWFESAGGVEDGIPCDKSTGNGCASGEAVEGINGGTAKTVGCVILGVFNLGAGVFCDVYLD